VKDILPAIMSNATEIYTDIKTVNSTQSALSRYLFGVSGDNEAITKLVDPEKFRPLRPILNELRVFKSESEVVNMRRAGRASGRAFTESMRKPFSTEKGLSAFLQYQFKAQGCDGSAFVPVVAGGRV
jgi:intermediate cleaving peptidase 55